MRRQIAEETRLVDAVTDLLLYAYKGSQDTRQGWLQPILAVAVIDGADANSGIPGDVVSKLALIEQSVCA